MAMATGNSGQRPYQPRAPHFQQHGTGTLSNSAAPQYGPGQGQGSRPSLQGPTGTDPAELEAYNAKLFEYHQDLTAKRLRKSIYRKTVDYFTPVVKYLEERSVFVEPSNFRDILADPLYYSEMLPPVAYPHNASNAITTKFIRQATNKTKCPVFVTLWTPDGRRLVTGSSSGEFTLWNGLTFNFETLLQAHDSPVRSMVWSRSDTWLVTGDAAGYIKYWQANMNNVKSYQAHRDSIRGITFCPTDFKFATGSDDGTIRIWDFDTCETIKVLRGGHGGEVKCVDWHPKKSLLVTGSRDNQQPVKLWDPRTADAIGTLYLHKGPVTDLKWNPINSNYLLTASRDSLVKLFDLRTMKDFQTCRGHKREVMSVAWHPIHQSHFCSGGIDGSLMFWGVGTEREVGFVDNAHDGSIWSMSWHPQGHILVTGSNDCSVKFWTRNRPGDPMKDKYNLKARGDSDTTFDINRSEMLYAYEEEEDEMAADAARAEFDSQDISEFESNKPRPLRVPGTPLLFPPGGLQQPFLQQGPQGLQGLQGPQGSQQFNQQRPFIPQQQHGGGGGGGGGGGFQNGPRGGFPDQSGPRFPLQQQHGQGDFRDSRRTDNQPINQYRDSGNRYDDRGGSGSSGGGGGGFHNRPAGDKAPWNQQQSPTKSDNQPPSGGWDNRPSQGYQGNSNLKDEWRDNSRQPPFQGGFSRSDTQTQAGQTGQTQSGGGSSGEVSVPETGRSVGLLPAPVGGPPLSGDYRRGDKRPWEASSSAYDDSRYASQGDDDGGQEGFGGGQQSERRDFRSRGSDRGGGRGGWRGGRRGGRY